MLFEELPGQGVVLLFRGTGCGYGVREFQELNGSKEGFRDQGLVLPTLSSGSQEDPESFSGVQDGYTLNGLIEDRKALPDPFRKGGITISTSCVMDRDGMLRDLVPGTRSCR